MKKLLIPLLCAFLLMGCNTSLSYTYDITTGDKIEVELNTTDKYSMTTGTIFEITKDGKEQCKVKFLEASKFEYYENLIPKDEKSTLIRKDTKDGNKYILWNYTEEDYNEYNYIILIDDSNTAVLINSVISQEVVEECFNRLTISLEE